MADIKISELTETSTVTSSDYIVVDNTSQTLKLQATKVFNPTVIDNVTSSSTTSPLSANQGRVLKAAIDEKQKALVAGTNITISGNTISSTNTTYSAGTGISLSGTTFSAKFGAINTSSLLASGIGTGSYTATQDCFLIGGMSTSGAATTLKVNNVTIGYMADYDFIIIPLKKGDKFTQSGGYGFNWYSYVFGVSY